MLADLAAPAPAGDGGVLQPLLILLVLMAGAKAGEEVARRLGQPGVVGELAGGFLVGPHALGLAAPDAVALVFAELGVVILIFQVGLEVRVDQILAVGRTAVLVAVLAMVLPIVAGLALMLAIGAEAATAAFIGLALAATSIGITSRVLAEMRVIDRAFSRVILGAAVIDDVVALLLIGVVSGVAQGNVSAEGTLVVIIAAIGLLGLGFAAARRARGLKREAFTWPLFADTPLVPAFLLMLAVALVAAGIGLAAIIGAFVAGLVLAETEARHELQEEMRPLGLIFTPFFFAVTGAEVDLGELLQPQVAGLAVALGVIGVVTKLGGGWLGALRLGRWPSFVVGAGMVPRGEVGIVVANIGLTLGLLAGDLFSATVVAVILTTVVAPYLLSFAIPRAARRPE
jgi:Kef-type K+ transport system membrane component KefB